MLIYENDLDILLTKKVKSSQRNPYRSIGNWSAKRGIQSDVSFLFLETLLHQLPGTRMRDPSQRMKKGDKWAKCKRLEWNIQSWSKVDQDWIIGLLGWFFRALLWKIHVYHAWWPFSFGFCWKLMTIGNLKKRSMMMTLISKPYHGRMICGEKARPLDSTW